MCIILLALNRHPQFPVILAGNRDELHARRAASGHFWADATRVLAGRDLEAGGTWLGVNRSGQWAVVSNIRGVTGTSAMARPTTTRGALVRDFLRGEMGSETYIWHVHAERASFQPFNLLLGDTSCAWYCSTCVPPQRLTAGIHGLSNAFLDTPWPKISRGVQALHGIVAECTSREAVTTALLHVLADRVQPPDEELPDTHVGLDRERQLAPIFVTGTDYGTRCSTVLTIDRVGRVSYVEQSYWRGTLSGRVVTRFGSQAVTA